MISSPVEPFASFRRGHTISLGRLHTNLVASSLTSLSKLFPANVVLVHMLQCLYKYVDHFRLDTSLKLTRSLSGSVTTAEVDLSRLMLMAWWWWPQKETCFQSPPPPDPCSRTTFSSTRDKGGRSPTSPPRSRTRPRRWGQQIQNSHTELVLWKSSTHVENSECRKLV